MDANSAYDAGFDAGYDAAYAASEEVNISELLEMGTPIEEISDMITQEAYEIEYNSRQYADFSFLAADINNNSEDEFDSEELWDQYDEGVSFGINAAIKEILEQHNQSLE